MYPPPLLTKMLNLYWGGKKIHKKNHALCCVQPHLTMMTAKWLCNKCKKKMKHHEAFKARKTSWKNADAIMYQTFIIWLHFSPPKSANTLGGKMPLDAFLQLFFILCCNYEVKHESGRMKSIMIESCAVWALQTPRDWFAQQNITAFVGTGYIRLQLSRVLITVVIVAFYFLLSTTQAWMFQEVVHGFRHPPYIVPALKGGKKQNIQLFCEPHTYSKHCFKGFLKSRWEILLIHGRSFSRIFQSPFSRLCVLLLL